MSLTSMVHRLTDKGVQNDAS